MKNKFDGFINFGSVADKNKRIEIANFIYNQLQKSPNITLSNENTDNFASTIENILSNETMRELCAKDPGLAEQITTDILDFINNAKRHIQRLGNPFENEQNLLNNFMQINKDSFSESWERTAPFIQKTYESNILDTEFYLREFHKSLTPQKKNKNSISFESIKEHFTDKWSALLFKKQTDWELSIIDEQRKKFCEELYKQIDNLKKLQEALSPFINELGRLWDMSKSRWQKVNFDVLGKYADLLQKDKALQELAEMLGRMHQAEKELEEELFIDIKFTTAWKIENSSKSDIIGVHESDDISNALPSEFALLADSTTETIFYKKLVEKKLQTFEYQGRTQEIIEEEFENRRQKSKEDKKGPFIICVDNSSSMQGTPETVAKTLCFAILKLAVRDNRKCYLIPFSTDIQTLNLTDLKNNLDKLINFLSLGSDGGTDATPAIREALNMLETEDYKKADVMMVSDGIMPSFDKEIQEKMKKSKENKTKYHSLIIGTSQNNEVIKDFDNNWFYNLNNKGSVLTLVKNLNSL